MVVEVTGREAGESGRSYMLSWLSNMALKLIVSSLASSWETSWEGLTCCTPARLTESREGATPFQAGESNVSFFGKSYSEDRWSDSFPLIGEAISGEEMEEDRDSEGCSVWLAGKSRYPSLNILVISISMSKL